MADIDPNDHLPDTMPPVSVGGARFVPVPNGGLWRAIRVVRTVAIPVLVTHVRRMVRHAKAAGRLVWSRLRRLRPALERKSPFLARCFRRFDAALVSFAAQAVYATGRLRRAIDDPSLPPDTEAGERLSDLFRTEALAAKRDTWLGEVRSIQPLPVIVITYVASAMMLCCLAYAFFGSYTRRVDAEGVLLPEAGLLAVTTLAGGTITDVAAREGETVHQGQLLYVIDLDAMSVRGPTRKGVIAALQQQKETLVKERELRLAISRDEKKGMQAQLQNMLSQHSEFEQQIAALTEALRPLKAKAEQFAAAASKGISPYASFQNQNFIYLQMLDEQARTRQSYLALEGHIAQTGTELSTFDDRLSQTVAGIDRHIDELDQQITENEGRQQIEIDAPQDGILTAQRVHVGQAVSAGATLVTLLPRSGRLEAHLYLDSASIGFIKEGAPVLLRYAAFPYRRFGLYDGVVKEVTRAPVSAANMQAELGGGDVGQPANVGPNDGGRYRVVVVPKQQFINAYGAQKKLEAGMRVTADISLDRRRLYQWALDPVYGLKESLRIVSGDSAQ